MIAVGSDRRERLAPRIGRQAAERWDRVYTAAVEGRYPRQPVRYGPDDDLNSPLFSELPLRLSELFR